MKLLLDTQLLLWAAGLPRKLPCAVRSLLEDPAVEPLYSAASLWEVAIKSGLARSDFRVDARLLRRGLLDGHYGELAITGAHMLGLLTLPPLHKNPFDRILIAQAMVEGITLLTADALVARYRGPVQKV